jgi:hypothetical protein
MSGLQGDIKALVLRPRPVIGKVDALLDQGVDIDGPVLCGLLDASATTVGTLAVLHDLVEIAPQRIRDLTNLCAQLRVEVCAANCLLQLTHERYPYNRANSSNFCLVLFLVKWIGPGVVYSSDLPTYGGAADSCPRPRRNWRLTLDFKISCIDTMAGRETV